MNYNWDWSVFFKSTGIGSETYLDWFISGLGWTIAILVVAWIVALILGSMLGVMRTMPNRLVAGVAGVYVGKSSAALPLLVRLFIWYFRSNPTCCRRTCRTGTSKTSTRPPRPT